MRSFRCYDFIGFGTYRRGSEDDDRPCTQSETDRQLGPPGPQETRPKPEALGEKTGLRQETISWIETGIPATKLETILTVLAALDPEFQSVPRSKGDAAAIEDIF